MIVSDTAILALETHWAVSALPGETRAWAFDAAKMRLVRQTLGDLLAVSIDEPTDAESVLERVAMAYELAAIEGLDALLHPSDEPESSRLQGQALAGAFRSFELRQCCQVPAQNEARVFHVLHLASLGFCGDRWPDVRRWINDHAAESEAPSVADVSWDKRVLFRLFDCWVRLFRKRNWDDVDRVRETVAGLREDQKAFEREVLGSADGRDAKAVAYRLISLYHWAKATEILAVYTLQGEPANVRSELDQHFEKARTHAADSGDAPLDVLLHWLHLAAVRMVAGSIWWVSQAVNSRVTRFVRSITKTRGLFDLLPPQRAAIQEQGLLDQASRAVVVDLPTSGGKTALAQFRILQALNQFSEDNGWVAYLAPTRALVAQITRRLRRDFSPLQIRVEQLSGAIEIDGFEEAFLTDTNGAAPFHVLISTPEKLNLVIRNKKVPRPLALVVMDEAHNIEDEERGLRIELLLATIKRDCLQANFLLLMPFVPNARDLARWLGAESGKTISLGTTPWQPNQRAVGLFTKERSATGRGDWILRFKTLTTSPKTMTLVGEHQVGPVRPLDISFTDAGPTMQAGAMAKVFSERGTSVAVAQQIPHVWSMAKAVAENLPALDPVPREIEMVQRFLETEISRDFVLVNMLGHGVGVHHAGLSDEARTLIEWLAEIGALRVLCATTTIAQGINFPVSSVFLASNKFPYGKEMPTRSFWNLAGRAGRMDQESVGIVGLAAGNDPADLARYVSAATGDLVSRLVGLLDAVEAAGKLNDLTLLIHEHQWTDFRCYVAHLWNEKKNLDAVLAETEQLLRNTYGFGVMQSSPGAGQRKAQALLRATTAYARELAEHPENSALADLTGFSPEGVRSALLELSQLENRLQPDDWAPASLFANTGHSALPGLFGVLLKVPQIGQSLREIGSHSMSEDRFAQMTQAWVNGKTLHDIATEFFSTGDTNATDAISHACRAIYKVLTNSGCWGLAALAKMPTSGIDFDSLTPEQRQRINNLPAMIYHGVKTDAAVLMRMNSVPRSVAESLGEAFERETGKPAISQTVGIARQFVKSLDSTSWDALVPSDSTMTGNDYREVWEKLSGEESD